MSDPVAIALDVDQLEWGVFVTDDGLVDRLSEALAGFKNYQPVWSAYANYLEAAVRCDVLIVERADGLPVRRRVRRR